MKNCIILLLLLFALHLTFAQQKDSIDSQSEELAVKAVIEQFLKVAGNYELDSMRTLFNANANIGSVSLKEGQWNTKTMSIEDFISLLGSREDPPKYVEPVSSYTIHMTEGMLAFVKAEAVLYRNGIPKSNNFDYFTLIKENENWKILNGSYVSIPIK